MTSFPASLELGTILRAMPSCWRSGSPIRDVKVAFDLGWANPLWSKRAAARVALKANAESGVARGRGNRAAKRAAYIETNQWFDSLPKIDDSDLGRIMEDFYSRKREQVPSFPNYPQFEF